MKIIILLNVIALSLAEPPVGNSYSSALSEHGHELDGQRSIPSSEGYPSTRNSLSQQYGVPNARSGPSQEYGVPGIRSGISQEYGTPNARGLSQEYGVPSVRLAQEYSPTARSQYSPNSRLSQQYGVPNQRSSQDFSAPRSIPSDSYGAPLQRSSGLYSAPDFRSTPSEEYGVPSRSFGSNQIARNPSQKYGAPSRNSQFAPSLSRDFTSNKPSLARGFGSSASSYKSSFGKSHARSFNPSTYDSRTPSAQYGTPTARNSDSYSQGFKSSSYADTQRSLSGTYGTPNERSVSQEYGVPLGRSALQTTAFPSVFGSARSSKYQARDMPSDQYGVPDQYSALSTDGLGYARGAVDELSQEPASYDFAYKVSDFQTGSDFGHTETRQENKAEGTYFVVLPDGTKQVVEYEADERGFKPRISVEPAEDGSGRSGYDENASDLARSGDGPY